jgi:hypothetical protein
MLTLVSFDYLAIPIPAFSNTNFNHQPCQLEAPRKGILEHPYPYVPLYYAHFLILKLKRKKEKKKKKALLVLLLVGTEAALVSRSVTIGVVMQRANRISPR